MHGPGKEAEESTPHSALTRCPRATPLPPGASSRCWVREGAELAGKGGAAGLQGWVEETGRGWELGLLKALGWEGRQAGPLGPSPPAQPADRSWAGAAQGSVASVMGKFLGMPRWCWTRMGMRLFRNWEAKKHILCRESGCGEGHFGHPSPSLSHFTALGTQISSFPHRSLPDVPFLLLQLVGRLDY